MLNDNIIYVYYLHACSEQLSSLDWLAVTSTSFIYIRCIWLWNQHAAASMPGKCKFILYVLAINSCVHAWLGYVKYFQNLLSNRLEWCVQITETPMKPQWLWIVYTVLYQLFNQKKNYWTSRFLFQSQWILFVVILCRHLLRNV